MTGAHNTQAHKTTITVTLFSRDPLTEPTDGDWWGALQAWIEEAVEGDMIGDWTIAGSTTVEGDDLTAQLVSIGNDGSFFDPLEWE